MTMDEMSELQRALGRLEGKVDAILSNQTLINARVESLFPRVRILESYRWFVLGGAAVVTFVVDLMMK